MVYFGTKLSENISRREPEGYQICLNVPVARTGTQEYLSEELGLEDEGPVIPVFRPEEEVFSPACMASFEGMPVTDDHPSFPEGVTAENIRYLQKGHAHNIRRGKGAESDLLLADLIITDPGLEEEIMNGKREISCGYNYVLSREGGRYIQREIRGNHVAVVDAGRAGPRVCIRDHANRRMQGFPAVGSGNRTDQKERSMQMKKSQMNMKDRQNMGGLRSSRGGRLSPGRVARIMAKMARDGETEELAEVIAEIMEPEIPAPLDEIPLLPADPVIAGAVEEILEGDEEEAAPAEAPVEVNVPENHEITIDCGMEILELLKQIVSLLSPAGDEDPEPQIADEDPTEGCGDEDNAEAAAEALAEAVTTAVENATGEMLTPDEDPLTAMVAEAVEQAVSSEAGEALNAFGALEAEAPLLPDGEEELAALLIEPQTDEDLPSEQTTDALRAAMVTFRPILKNMAPAARRKAVAKIASNLKARDRKRTQGKKGARTSDTYARLKGAARRGGKETTEDLGRKIMSARNPHYRARS